MFNWLNLISVNCDDPTAWVLYFQNTASPQMGALVESHDNIMFYLVIILFGVAWILISIIGDYVQSKISNKYLNHGALIESISVNTFISWLVLFVAVRLNLSLKPLLGIMVYVFINQRLIILSVFILVRTVYTLYDVGNLWETMIIFIDSPRSSGEHIYIEGINAEIAAERSNRVRYIFSEHGMSLWSNNTVISRPEMINALGDLGPDYANHLKLSILETARTMHVPGEGPVKLKDVLLAKNTINADVAILRGHCDFEPVFNIKVITPTGNIGRHFKDVQQ